MCLKLILYEREDGLFDASRADLVYATGVDRETALAALRAHAAPGEEITHLHERDLHAEETA